MKEKTLGMQIYETEATLKEVIAQANLDVSIVKLILGELYSEVCNLAERNLSRSIAEYRAAKEEEESKDGEHNTVPDSNT